MSQRGRRLGADAKAPESFGKGRRCSAQGCETILSRYTKGDFCWQHERRGKPRASTWR